MASSSRPVVVVLAGGLALSVGTTVGCFPHRGVQDPTPTPGDIANSTPPAPAGPLGKPAVPTANPPPPPDPQPSDLPVWEDVASDHPSGATNPPRPVLVALADGSRCWKQWLGGMMRPDPQVLKLGGRVVTTAAEVDNATEIQCPADRMDQLLGAHRGE